MGEDSFEQRMAAYAEERADGPFGDVELASGRTLAPFSRVGMDAATTCWPRRNVLVPSATSSGQATSWTVPCR